MAKKRNKPTLKADKIPSSIWPLIKMCKSVNLYGFYDNGTVTFHDLGTGKQVARWVAYHKSLQLGNSATVYEMDDYRTILRYICGHIQNAI